MKTLAAVILAVVLAMFGAPAQAASAAPAHHTSHAVKAKAHKAPVKAHKAHKAPAKVKAPAKAKAKAKAPVRCEEDQPCWNCKTMGNKICGPVAPVDCTPRKGMAWPSQCKAPTQWVDYGPVGLTPSQIEFCQHPYLGGAWAGATEACKLAGY